MHSIEIIVEKIIRILHAIKPQPEALYQHLRKVMKYQGIYYPKFTPIFHVGDDVNKAMFVSEGFILKSAMNTNKDIKILGIFEENEIKAGPDFIEQTPSEVEISACAGTFIAYITFAQMEVIYKKFPGTRELAALIISAHNRKETRLKNLFSVKGIELVYNFYTRYPKLNTQNPAMTMEQIASYLEMGESTLYEYKAKLIREGRLPDPSGK